MNKIESFIPGFGDSFKGDEPVVLNSLWQAKVHKTKDMDLIKLKDMFTAIKNTGSEKIFNPDILLKTEKDTNLFENPDDPLLNWGHLFTNLFSSKNKDQFSELMGDPLADMWWSLNGQTLQNIENRKKLHKFLSVYSLWPKFDTKKITRFFPIWIYSNSVKMRPNRLFYDLLPGFAELSNLKIVDICEPVIGSYFQQFLMKSDNPLTNDSAQRIWEKIDLGLDKLAEETVQDKELRHFTKGVAILLESLNEPNLSILFGKMLIIKMTKENNHICIITKILTEKESVFVITQPELFKEPDLLLKKLSEIDSLSKFGDASFD